LAGTNRMPWPRFLVYNAAGGILWAPVYGLLGYFLGQNLPLLSRVIRFLGIGGLVAAIVIAAVALVLWRRRAPRR
jgi:membrane protein DedA with SNARE-associated domain